MLETRDATLTMSVKTIIDETKKGTSTNPHPQESKK